ncbi:hypothetical protein Droror1_Dr00003457 [Drosera rotundifolia]
MVESAINGSSKNPNMKKKKKKNLSKKTALTAVSMKPQPPKPNPFETIWSRRKFDIIGKKRKGEERRIGLARSLAVEKRKKTLLKEYEQSGKASVFVDRRIGEKDDALGEFDKGILRSQRERQIKFKKSSKYNLSDGEDEEFDIHGGDDFHEDLEHGDSDGDQSDDDKRSHILKQLGALSSDKFLADGSTEGEENRHRSSKEIYKEIILKNKLYKAQKVEVKEENEMLTEQLDKDFESLMQSESLMSHTQPGKLIALQALVNKSIPKEIMEKDQKSVSGKSSLSKKEEPDSYDKLYSEMLLEARARGVVDTIPREEKEREKQEVMEKDRQRRKLPTDDSSGEEDDAPEDHRAALAQRSRPVSGDDLGDSFSLDEKVERGKGWVDEILGRENIHDSEDGTNSDDSESDEQDSDGTDDENDENAGTLKEWEQDDDDLGADVEVDEEEDEKRLEGMNGDCQEMIDASVKHRGGKADILSIPREIKTQLKELPSKLGVPSGMDELRLLLENRSNEEIIEAIRQIRVQTPIKENRKKIQAFYGLLLQFFATLADVKPLNLELLNFLAKPLMEMSWQIPFFAAICARERISRTRARFCEDIKNPDKSSWPSVKTLMLLRLWSMTFPCSDFRHAVLTPSVLLMCEYLMRCPLLCGRDVAMGLLLCSMVLLVTRESQKFCPEALIFLKSVLVAAIDKYSESCQMPQQSYDLLELKAPKPLLYIKEEVHEICALEFLDIVSLPEDSAFFSSDNFRASVLVFAVEVLREFVELYGELRAFPEIFLPISKIIVEVAEQATMPGLLQDKLGDVADLVTKKVDELHKLRQPLQMRKQKPVPIKLLNPKFEENFVKGRDYDPDRERLERRKLNKRLKQEAKGAARELRKDNRFLFEVKEKERAKLEEERAEKYGKARAFLQEQEHAFKSGQLGKGRKRRR